ncbi:MAG: serine protease [Myxococcota bacterium]
MHAPPVVKIFATTQDHDYESPWQAKSPSRSTGSGVILGPHRVLTGAHVIANATFLQIQQIAVPDKPVARVIAVCHDSDLALLEVPDVDLTANTEPVVLGDLPELRDKVSVLGFPVGGEEISVTEGVVSRIEVQRYTHSQRRLLAVTVDAAINNGNSGGPAFIDGRMVGVAFQSLADAENIGELVPMPLVRLFLDAVEQGRQPAIPGLGIYTQNLENPELRRRRGLPEGQSGVLITKVAYGSSADGVLQADDVLVGIDGLAIANNGTVQYRGRYRTRFSVVLGEHHLGDALAVTVWRDGQARQETVTLRPRVDLVPRSVYGVEPTWFIYGGLVFQRLTRNFLTTWDRWWNNAPTEFLNEYYIGTRTGQRQEIVVLTQILADDINVGYAPLYDEAVLSVNGTLPRDMAHFVELVDSATDVVEIVTTRRGVAVFDPSEVAKAMPRILERYRIPRDRSAHLPGPRDPFQAPR